MLNKTPMIIRVTTGTEAVLRATTQGWQGELALATDTGRLLVCPATESPFVSAAVGSSPPVYTVTNATTDRTYDANATTLDEIADVLGTLIADLKAAKILG